MPVTRHFLGHATPLLPRAARWLARETAAQGGAWIVAVPTARAGRRLRELLVAEAGGALADPPRVVGIAQVLEALEPKRLPAPEPEQRRAALLAALMELPADPRATLSRQLTDAPSVAAEWQVAGRLLQTLQTLWAGGAKAAQVAEESPRHAALAALENAYAKRMPSDPDLRRLAQLEVGCAPAAQDLHLVLVGCLDLHGVVAKGLGQWAQAGLSLHVLSPAESADADAFGELGQVTAAAWTERPLALAPGELAGVESVNDIRAGILRLLESAGPLAPEDATVVLCDETQGPRLSAQLRAFGFKTRLASGEPLATRDAGAVALAVLALWRERGHAELRRLAAVWPEDTQGHAKEAALLDEARKHVLCDLDALPAIAATTRGALAQWGGLPAPRERAPLSAWIKRLAGLLASAFPGVHAPTSPNGQALQAIGGRLHALASTPLPALTAEEAAVILTDDLAAVRLPDLQAPIGQGELIGLLDALLDEAPVMAVCGALEGALPDFRAGDPFLPGLLRQRLGLPTEESLRARDKALLALALAPRRAKAVVVPRRGLEGDPLQPAQLLFEGLPDDERAARSLLLFGDARDQAQSGLPRVAPLPLPQAGRAEGLDLFLPVLPPRLEDGAWRARMAEKGVSVTSLKTLLACPARFALQHASGWRATDEPPAELEGNGFGNLLHEVLSQFHAESIARPDWRPREDALADHLEGLLDREATRQLGAAPGLAVALQLERARTRLQAFAAQQVELWREGWVITAAECRQEALLDLPEGDVLLHGRVDRVDRRGNALRIVDFKTGDDGLAPRKTHLSKQGWTDLQLPLYESLAWRTGLAQPGDQVETGYFLLDPSAKGWTPADFTPDETGAAVATAEDLLARVLRQEFPVGEPAEFDDGLGALLCDEATDRAARLARAQAQTAGGDA